MEEILTVWLFLPAPIPPFSTPVFDCLDFPLPHRTLHIIDPLPWIILLPHASSAHPLPRLLPVPGIREALWATALKMQRHKFDPGFLFCLSTDAGLVRLQNSVKYHFIRCAFVILIIMLFGHLVWTLSTGKEKTQGTYRCPCFSLKMLFKKQKNKNNYRLLKLLLPRFLSRLYVLSHSCPRDGCSHFSTLFSAVWAFQFQAGYCNFKKI